MENKEIIIIALVVIAIYLYASYYRHLDSDTKLLVQAKETAYKPITYYGQQKTFHRGLF